MEAIGRVFGVLASVALGIAMALLILPALILFDPFPAGDMSLLDSLAGFMDLLDGGPDEIPSNEALMLFVGFIWTAALMICVVPIVLSALIGEIAAVRSLLWYAGGAGCLAATMPWLLRAIYHLGTAGSATPLELHFAALFFLTGAMAGFIYWLVCGHRAGLRALELKTGATAQTHPLR